MFQLIVLLTIAAIIWSAWGLAMAVLGLIGLLFTVAFLTVRGAFGPSFKEREADAIRRAQTGYQFWD